MSAPFTRTETAPVLRTFGAHAARIAILVRLRPSLLPRLAFAPGSAVHAIGAWLHLAPEADLPDGEVAAILDETAPHHLLRAAIPNAPARLYRALDRAGDRVRERRFYERLAAICAGPAVDVLWGDHAIDDALLAYGESLTALDPQMLRLRAVLPRSAEYTERLHVVITFLKAHNALTDADLVLPPQAGLPALATRLQAVLDRIEAPHPGFELPPPLRVLRTVGELRAVGKKLNNCVANADSHGLDYGLQLVNGSTVFVACDTPPFLATLTRVGPRLWVFGQMSTTINQRVSAATLDGFRRDVKAAGVALLPHGVSWSLTRVLGAQRPSRRRNGLAGLDGGLAMELDPDLAA